MHAEGQAQLSLGAETGVAVRPLDEKISVLRGKSRVQLLAAVPLIGESIGVFVGPAVGEVGSACVARKAAQLSGNCCK